MAKRKAKVKEKRILILEDDPVKFDAISTEATRRGYTLVGNFEGQNLNEVLDGVEELIESEKPGYAMLGTLRGRCLGVARKIRGKVNLVIYTGNTQIIKSATELDYNVFNSAASQSGLENAFKALED